MPPPKSYFDFMNGLARQTRRVKNTCASKRSDCIPEGIGIPRKGPHGEMSDVPAKLAIAPAKTLKAVQSAARLFRNLVASGV